MIIIDLEDAQVVDTNSIEEHFSRCLRLSLKCLYSNGDYIRNHHLNIHGLGS